MFRGEAGRAVEQLAQSLALSAEPPARTGGGRKPPRPRVPAESLHPCRRVYDWQGQSGSVLARLGTVTFEMFPDASAEKVARGAARWRPLGSGGILLEGAEAHRRPPAGREARCEEVESAVVDLRRRAPVGDLSRGPTTASIEARRSSNSPFSSSLVATCAG